MKRLYILEILLLSQKEKRAKRVQFDKYRTLICGKNHTGKSSLIKSIYRTFGAEPALNPRFAESEVISCVKFEVDGIVYQIIRDGKRIAIFDNSDCLLITADSISKELTPYFSDFFDFKPIFQAQNGNFIVPPPAYLLLPFYIDQDESWVRSWCSFKKLQQIKDYRNQCIYYHSGIRPNIYYETKKEIDAYSKLIDETEKERKITSNILNNIKNQISQVDFNVDIEIFKDEIIALLNNLEKLKEKEDNLKRDLHKLYHLKANYEIQVDIVKKAVIESNKDYDYALNMDSCVSCPTCGAEYENSFAERFTIAHDEQKCKDLLIDLRRDIKKINDEIEEENDKLNIYLSEINEIELLLETKKKDIYLKDIIESSGKNHIKEIFNDRYCELQNIILENNIEKEKCEKKLKALESKKHRDKIISMFSQKITLFLQDLDIIPINNKNARKINIKIESLETGSSKPRALIAYYFAFFHLMNEFSSATYMPIIVDSPNQQDQDVEHIDKIMKFIDCHQPEDSQMILGVVETYGVDFNCTRIELIEKYHLLQEDEYNSVYFELKDKIYAMWE